MFVRQFVAMVMSAAVVAFAVGCSGAESPSDSSTDTKKSGADEGTSNGGDTSSNRDGTSRNGTGTPDDNTSTDDSPTDPPATSKKKNGAQCKDSADCESDFCVFQGSGLGMCTTTCDSNIDCDLGHNCVKLGNAPQKVCVPN